MAHDTGSACSCWRSPASASRSPSSAQEDDRAALIALHTATVWAHWTTTTSLAPLGTWHGVTTDGDGRVTRLSLEDNKPDGGGPVGVGPRDHPPESGRPDGRTVRSAQPRDRHVGRGHPGAGPVAGRAAGPARRIHGGDRRRRFARSAADRRRIAGAGRRAVDLGSDQPGRRQSARPAAHGHPVVQCQHAADQRRVYGRPAGDAAQLGAGPHACPGERQAPPPLVDHRLARRQRRGVRLAGSGHFRHPGHRAAAG